MPYQLPDIAGLQPDKCVVPRIQSLYYSKRHAPFCSGMPNMLPMKTAGIELLPSRDVQCASRVSSKVYSVTFPLTCADTIYPDEIAGKIHCSDPVVVVPPVVKPQTDSAALAVVSTFLMVFLAALSACA